MGPGMFDNLFAGVLFIGAVIGAGAVLAIFGLWHLIAWLAVHLTWS